MTHALEPIAVMDPAATSFGKHKNLSVSRTFALVLCVIFVCSLVATGLIVYQFASHKPPYHGVVSPTECQKSTAESVIIPTTVVHHISATSVVATTKNDTPVASAPTPASSHVPKKVVDVRLPRSLVPHNYNLKLIPFIYPGNFTFHGEVRILVNVTSSTDNVTLHVNGIDIDLSSATVTTLDDQTVPIRSFGNDTEKQFFVIRLSAHLQQGSQYYVQLKYKGSLNHEMQGFYRSSYSENGHTRWIAATQFQPTEARSAFPCFDEPAMKAKFTISLARFTNMTSISNMPKIRSEPVKGLPDYVWDHFAETVPMSTYLVAFAVTDFEKITSGNFTVWARRNAIAQAQYSLDIGPKLLRFFENFFDIKFPLPKIDMVALPDFSAGAMENWGLITFRETTLLYEEGVSTRNSVQRIASVVAHELAHQWFGNLVTPKWWTDLWLNEGFATYMEYVGTNAIQPTWNVMDQFVVHELHDVLSLDALKTSHQISIVVNNPNEINDIFDRISYFKGATLIYMMEDFLSPASFRRGLTNYLNSRRYSNAQQDDLWTALTEQAHSDGTLESNVTVKEIMDTWTLQTGVPVVIVTRNYNYNTVRFSQNRFLMEPGTNSSEALDLWWIPIRFLSRSTPARHSWFIWLEKVKEKTVTEFNIPAEDWLLVNVDQKGYYRVNYDTKNWLLLTSQLRDPKGYRNLSAANRAQIVDDALNLAAAGYLDYDIALNITRYLVYERDYVPWKSAFASLDFLHNMFERNADYDKFKEYLLILIDDFYKEVQFKDSKTDSQLTVYSRKELLWRACRLGKLDCVREAVRQYQNWRSSADPDRLNPISPDLKTIVYCTAIRTGNQEEWDFAWERYLQTNVGSDKDIILNALGCSREIWILNRYLYRAMNESSGIRKQDAVQVFAAVSKNPIGQPLAYKFLKSNWNNIKKYMQSSLMLLNGIVRTCTFGFNSQDEVDDLKRFMNSREDLSIVSKTLAQAVEQSEVNVRWMNRNYRKIVQWLTDFSGKP